MADQYLSPKQLAEQVLRNPLLGEIHARILIDLTTEVMQGHVGDKDGTHDALLRYHGYVTGMDRLFAGLTEIANSSPEQN